MRLDEGLPIALELHRDGLVQPIEQHIGGLRVRRALARVQQILRAILGPVAHEILDALRQHKTAVYDRLAKHGLQCADEREARQSLAQHAEAEQDDVLPGGFRLLLAQQDITNVHDAESLQWRLISVRVEVAVLSKYVAAAPRALQRNTFDMGPRLWVEVAVIQQWLEELADGNVILRTAISRLTQSTNEKSGRVTLTVGRRRVHGSGRHHAQMLARVVGSHAIVDTFGTGQVSPLLQLSPEYRSRP